MKNKKLIITNAFAICVCLTAVSCAKKEYVPSKKQITIQPIQVDNGKSVHADPTDTLKYPADSRRIQLGNTYGTEDAIRIKSHVYAQVPKDTTIFPEIHTADTYTPSTHETSFDLKPLHSVPQTGYYPNGERAYTQDVQIIQGKEKGDVEKTGHNLTTQVPKRKYIKIRAGENVIQGHARVLGITEKSQIEDAKLQVFTDEGESLRYVSNLGWIAIIEK